MKVQMITQISGTRNGADWPAVGGVVDLPEGEAKDIIQAGLARVPVVETATARKPETATRKGLSKKDI